MAINGNSKLAVVAERELKTGDRLVRIKIYAPVEVGQDEWRCDFDISGVATKPPSYAIGVDSLHALLNALHGLRIKLDPSLSDLTWKFGTTEGSVGLPRFVPDYLGKKFEDEILRVIEANTKKIKQSKTPKRKGSTKPAS